MADIVDLPARRRRPPGAAEGEGAFQEMLRLVAQCADPVAASAVVIGGFVRYLVSYWGTDPAALTDLVIAERARPRKRRRHRRRRNERFRRFPARGCGGSPASA